MEDTAATGWLDRKRVDETPRPSFILEESNAFLRALLARMRADFERVQWLYSPRRFGGKRTIRLGFADLDAYPRLAVSIYYKTRGVIDALIIENLNNEEISTPLSCALRHCVQKALGESQTPPIREYSALVSSTPQAAFAAYNASHFAIQPAGDGKIGLTLHIEAFDTYDAESVFMKNSAVVLDLMAAWTNCAFRLEPKAHEERQFDETVNPNVYWAAPDWLDDFPYTPAGLGLTPELLSFTNQFVADSLGRGNWLLRAAHLHHRATRLYYENSRDYDHLVTVLFMSSLETASLNQKNTRTCKTCGQTTYSISKRVREFARRHHGDAVENIVKMCYSKRSKYLHEGLLQANQPWGRKLQPLLEPEAPEGCAMPLGTRANKTLMEFTSYILRNVCQSRAAAAQDPMC